MLVFALQFSRSARHDVEANNTHPENSGHASSACHTSQQRTPTPNGAGLMLGVEGNSLKMEEKTRAAERLMVKR